MNVIINSVHFRADKKLEAFITDKVNKLNTYFDGVIVAEVKLKLDNNETRFNKIVEMRLGVRGNDLYAVKEARTFEEATDYAVEALRKQLVKYKNQVRHIS